MSPDITETTSGQILEWTAKNDVAAFRAQCEEMHPAAVGELLAELEPEQMWAALAMLEAAPRAEIFSHLPEESQIEIIERRKRSELAELFTELPADDRAHIFRRLPDDCQERVMPVLARAEREDIRRLASYEEGTAGSVMTSDYATIPPDITAEQAVERLRQVAPDKETVYTAFVVDADRRLLGSVSLYDLIVARRNRLVRDLISGELIAVHVNDDQEEAARMIEKYDLIALPVVNDDMALMGIITCDDAIDVLSQEHNEDLEKLMAIAGDHEDRVYLSDSPWRHFLNRAGWVAALGVVGILSGTVVQHFEFLTSKFTVLTAFMPMLAAAGGNTGSQTATLVIRGLGTEELTARDLPRILAKELAVSLMTSLVLAAIVFCGVLVFGRAPLAGPCIQKLAGIIALAIGIQVLSATLVGAILPVAATRMKLDPAVVASPALTTIVDLTGLLMYFSLAQALLL